MKLARWISLTIICLVLGMTVFVPTAKAQTSSASISLVAQSLWADEDESVAIELRASGDLAKASLDLQLLEAIDRTELQGLRQGVLPNPIMNPIQFPVVRYLNNAGIASLEIDMPPNPAETKDQATIHPLVIKLVDANNRELDRLVTPVIRLPTNPIDQRLMVAIGLEFTAPPPLGPDGSTKLDQQVVRNLRALADAAKDHPSVPINVRFPPATIVGLSRSVEVVDAQLLNDLELIVNQSLQVTATSYVTADPEAWRQADRSDVFSDLLDHGELVLARHLNASPTRQVAFLPPTAVPATLDLLNRLGSNRFIVSGSQLDPQPTSDTSIVKPIHLLGAEGSSYPALISDPDLANHLGDERGAVLAVQHLVADLALLSWSMPDTPGGVILTIPTGLSLDGLMLDLLLGALDTAPFLEPVALSSLFESLVKSEQFEDEIHEMWPEAVVAMSRRATDRSLAEATVSAYSALLGGPNPATAGLNDLLEVTAAAELDTDAMSLYLSAVYARVTEILDGFSAPENQNVRLTSRRADVPFTVNNLLDSQAHVLLVLQSDGRLDFPDGPTLPVLLEPGINRIPIPIKSRTSGDAQLQVTVRSPDEARLLQLESTRIFVRTIQLSGVGILLFIGAISVLAIWWIKSARLRS